MKPLRKGISFHDAKVIIIGKEDQGTTISIRSLKKPIRLSEFNKIEIHPNRLAFARPDGSYFSLYNVKNCKEFLKFLLGKIKQNILDIRIPGHLMLSLKELQIEGDFGIQFSGRMLANKLDNKTLKHRLRLFKLTNDDIDRLKANDIPERLQHRCFIEVVAEVLGTPSSFRGSSHLFWKKLAKGRV